MIIPSPRRRPATGNTWLTHAVIQSPPLSPRNSSIALWPLRNRLYIGHGEWNENLGPVSVLSVGGDGGLVNHLENAPTEAFNCFREIDGSIYAPYTDPKGVEQGGYGGYATNAGGVWHKVKMNVPMIHCFDIVKTSHGLFMTGSARADGNSSEPIVARSTDGGATWAETHHSSRWVEGRYYGIVAEGATLFVRHSNGQQSVESSINGGVTWRPVNRPDLHMRLSSVGYRVSGDTISDWPIKLPSGATKPVRMGDKAYCCAQTGTSVTIYRRPAPPTS